MLTHDRCPAVHLWFSEKFYAKVCFLPKMSTTDQLFLKMAQVIQKSITEKNLKKNFLPTFTLFSAFAVLQKVLCKTLCFAKNVICNSDYRKR
jgi:hypothetical protein